ncbi:MAG: LamG domain-containing protein [Roseiflexus sp.]|nr:LamG domain-containing protein [Roseiflexus sp.]MCS7290426.1 LamG domain-containing protein [Roseiflexus sp.]MDW8147667.1 LamG-like jellyroll fold domain-containing protein [Roseiflexaceae bacterium]MDW8231490.1 LamG-like jellyroll fold domain-containing protein [Roseiflexaceae bacterium]
MPLVRPYMLTLLRLSLFTLALLLLLMPARHGRAQGDFSLRFYGTGRDGVDRVVIPLDAPPRPVDVGGDFTIEFWLKALPGENAAAPCTSGGDNWINGNIVFDRDVYFAGDYGDYGISLAGGRVAFGVNNGAEGTTLCGRADVTDGRWHHLAVTRSAANGALAIFVDGRLDARGDGPTGDVSYRDGRTTQYPADPFLVIGAEKHDAGPEYPSFHGWIDEVRISRVVRYREAFVPPTTPFAPDPDTVALYHFNEGAGTAVSDASGAPGGPSDGFLRIGGSPPGPEWSNDTPWIRPIAPTAASPSIPAQTTLPLILQPSPNVGAATQTSAPSPAETASPTALASPATPVMTLLPSPQEMPVAGTVVPSPVAAPHPSVDPSFWLLGVIAAGLLLAGVGLALMVQRKKQ